MVSEDEIIQQTEKKDETDDVKKKKEPAYKSEAIRTLTDYYQTDKLPASNFLRTLKKNKVGRLQDDDIQRCLEGLDDADPDFVKTLDLLYRAVGIQTPLAKQCISFASQACRQQLNVHNKIEIDLNKAANIIFDEVIRILKPELTGKKVSSRSFNLLKAFGILKRHSRNLDEVEIIELLTKELMSQEERGSDGLSSVADILFRPATKIKAMTDILQVAENGVAKAKLARQSEIRERQQREKEYGRAQDLQEKLNRAIEELHAKEREIGELKTSLAHSEDEKTSLEQKIEHAQAVSTHGKEELRGRSRVFLEKKLTPLLKTAQEFAELDPPRKNIIVERLEMAMEEIRREIEWL